jgi:hypothetical protein
VNQPGLLFLTHSYPSGPSFSLEPLEPHQRISFGAEKNEIQWSNAATDNKS